MLSKQNVIATLALLLFSLVAIGAAQGPTSLFQIRSGPAGAPFNVIDNIALNATASTRTTTVPLKSKWSKLLVGIEYTWSAASTVTATPTCALHSAGQFYSITTRAIDAGTATASALVDSQAVTSSEDWMWEYDVRGCEEFKIVFAGASAGAGDLIDVEITAVVGE